MTTLPILLYPDPALRRPADPVSRFDAELAELTAAIVETMHAAPGVGLAAPQVGHSLRLAVVDVSAGEDPEAVMVLVNPHIVAEEGSAVEIEGCLSIPELTDKVERPARIEVEAQDLDGGSRRFSADGLTARAICHEVDHLDGVLFVDRLRGLRRERARRHLRRLEREAVAVAR